MTLPQSKFKGFKQVGSDLLCCVYRYKNIPLFRDRAYRNLIFIVDRLCNFIHSLDSPRTTASFELTDLRRTERLAACYMAHQQPTSES
jgi:hypothetical protein